MKIEVNNSVIFADWQYENPELAKLMQEKNVSEEERKKLTTNELMDILGIKSIPNPNITTCIVKKEDGTEILRATVKRHKHDKYDKNKARTFTLVRVANTLFPGRENKENRRAIWNAYLQR